MGEILLDQKKVKTESYHDRIPPNSKMSVTEFPPLLSEEDLQKYKVPLRWRDRCAAYFALYHTCLIRQTANSSVDCKHDKHAWEECQNLDFIRRQKELKEAKEKRRAELNES